MPIISHMVQLNALFCLLHGSALKVLVDILFGLELQDCLQTWKQGMEEACAIETKCVYKATEKGKKCYDTKVRSLVLQPGECILVKYLSP